MQVRKKAAEIIYFFYRKHSVFLADMWPRHLSSLAVLDQPTYPNVFIVCLFMLCTKTMSLARVSSMHAITQTSKQPQHMQVRHFVTYSKWVTYTTTGCPLG